MYECFKFLKNLNEKVLFVKIKILKNNAKQKFHNFNVIFAR